MQSVNQNVVMQHILVLHYYNYNLNGATINIRSIIDQNVILQRMTVHINIHCRLKYDHIIPSTSRFQKYYESYVLQPR
jgi:hypothetical protein